jgi:two-component system C4-dicarboxylate transport sensor histidine kinase DctB
VALLVVLLVTVPVVVGRITYDTSLARLNDAARASAQTRVLALDSILDRQRAVAVVLSVDQQVIQTLRAGVPADDAVSAKLDLLREETQSSVVYLVNAEGRAVAASNWNQPVSFLGYDYAFRDYFRQAIQYGTGQEYALGTVSRRPGLYLAHDIRDNGRPIGVIVVKIEFNTLEAAWARDPDRTHVLDADGTVVISSTPALRFQDLPQQSGFLTTKAAIRRSDWTLVVQTPRAGAQRLAGLAAGTTFLMVLLGGIATALVTARLRRAARHARTQAAYRDDLERAVAARTRDLSDEMRERHTAEQRLIRLQSDLVQANKLATLGQITAGVAHELNQPLATIRLLAENGTNLLPPQPVRDNLTRIIAMTDRIATITQRLRSFSRKATGTVQAVLLEQAIQASLMLTASRRRASTMQFELPDLPADLYVRAESVRLEQILVNLLTNAHDAQIDRPDPWIRIQVDHTPQHVTLTITDNGPGIAPDMAAQLFTPFATDKPQGMGLGLVISRDIARDFGGELDLLSPKPDQGASFRLTIPRAR